MTDTLVTTAPWPDHIARIKELSATDPSSVFFAQVLPRGYDAEADRLRDLGLVQIFRCDRPIRIRAIDPVAHRLIRKG